MKAKKEKIKAWLDFLQADLDNLLLDEKVSLIYGVFEDIFFNKPFWPLEKDGKPVDSLEKLRDFLNMADEEEWEKLILREVQLPLWKEIQLRTKAYFERILKDPTTPWPTKVEEYLIMTPSGVFHKGAIPSGRATIQRAGIPALSSILDGVPISAFKRCLECEKWFFHTSKRKKEFCTNRCASRYLTREKRTETEEAREEYNKKMRDYMKKRRQENNPKSRSKKLVRCPGNPDDPDVEMTPNECINLNGKNIRGIWKNTCPTCQHFKKGGIAYENL
ncbi:MAG: hypothetical protein ACFFCW_37745 [Candidatus Hodarchaeota archaeon]